MYLDRILEPAGSFESHRSEAQGKIYGLWRELSRRTNNLALLSGSFRSGYEAITEDLAEQVREQGGLCFYADCQERGEYNLGIFRRLHRAALSLAAADSEISGLLNSYQPSLSSLFADPGSASGFHARINKIVEVKRNYLVGHLNNCAGFWHDLLSLLAIRTGRPPLLIINNLQWIDPYSTIMLRQLLQLLLSEHVLLVMTIDPQIGRPETNEVLGQLIREGCVLEINPGPAAEVSESESLNRFRRQNSLIQDSFRLLATTTEEMPTADLLRGCQLLSPSCNTASMKLSPGRWQLRACWKRLVFREADNNLGKLHVIHAELQLGSSRNPNAGGVPVAALHHLLAAKQSRLLLDHYYQMGLDAFEKVGDVSGAMCFYERLTRLKEATKPELALLHGKLAFLHSLLKNVEQAQVEYAQALALEEDPIRRAILQAHRLVLMCKQTGASTETADHSDPDIKDILADSPEKRYAVVRLLNAQALAYYKGGDYEGALGILRKANTLLRAVRSFPEISNYRLLLFKNMASVCMSFPGRTRSVARYYKAARRVAQIHGDRPNVTFYNLKLASLYMKQGDSAGSESLLNAACAPDADASLLVDVHLFAIRNYRNCNQLEPEEKWIRRLAELYLSLGRITDAVDLLIQKGSEYYNRRLYPQAAHFLDGCLSLAAEPPASRLYGSRVKAHTYRAMLACMTGDTLLGRQHINQAIAIQSELAVESPTLTKLHQLQSVMLQNADAAVSC
jgi:tetratricopeptide (TPR) repeat protein